MSCASCEDLKDVLITIKEGVARCACDLTADQLDDVTYRCDQAVEAINAWKAHQVRFVQQDKPRHAMLDKLSPQEVTVTQDWAMKFLPQKYRETQADWFGKRGISWHISVAARKTPEGKLQQQSLVHVVKNCSQDTPTVVSIMEHVLRTIKGADEGIDTAFYRQDNAGCYHSVGMLAAAHLMDSSTGIKVP